MKLIDYFLSNKDRRLIHKPINYFEIYEAHFERFKNKNAKILEIGVQNGGFMRMWKQYFGKGTEFVGIDIDPRCMRSEEENVKIYIGDQGDMQFLKSVTDKEGTFDIIMDDAGHFVTPQLVCFETLFPFLNEGGIYLCEDLGTNYMNVYGGGRNKAGTFIERIKKLIDVINQDKTDVYSIHVYESVVVIEKRKYTPHDTRAIGKTL